VLFGCSAHGTQLREIYAHQYVPPSRSWISSSSLNYGSQRFQKSAELLADPLTDEPKQ